MRRLMIAALLAAPLLPAGCGPKPITHQNVVSHWGTYHVDEDMQLRVSAVGMTQMRYELRHQPTNRLLISDYGLDSRGWVFVWDDLDRLWAHWAELGTVVWVPQEEGRFEKVWLTPDSEMIGEMPAEFASQLPASARRDLGLF
jgi:hypothetical protein